MTKTEWRESSDPQLMLEILREKAAKRKLSLFAAACSRRVWHLLPDGPIRELVGLIERWAEGMVSERELYWAAWDRHAACYSLHVDGEAASTVLAAAGLPPAWVIGQVPSGTDLWPVVRQDIAEPHLVSRVKVAAYHSAWALAWEADPEGYAVALEAAGSEADSGDWVEQNRSMMRRSTSATRWASALWAAEHEQAAWLREIFGNPFRSVAIDPVWLTGSEGAVRKMAQAIYDDNCFEQMPILADTLEETGCTDADPLVHCREPGEHVRGCWVLDLLLGKV
jgi:hypothetical protein